MVVILVVLTTSVFRFSLVISQLLAKAIPVRGAKFEKPAQGILSGFFYWLFLATPVFSSEWLQDVPALHSR